MTLTRKIEFFVSHEQEGQYLTLPFQMPENIAEFQLSYNYPRIQEEHEGIPGGEFFSIKDINTIDLGLLDPEGNQVGASGSDKSSFFINANQATPGYQPWELVPGEWKILIGAYKVATEGVQVAYELNFIPKERRLYIGDLHTHTIASDGVLSLEVLASHALQHGLDFLAITDHNQMSHSETLRKIENITLIQGVEWTHYRGHANFLGVDQPYDQPFFTHTEQETQERFISARDRGALIVINHPCDPSCGFHYDLDALPYDCIEIWNGPMRESNLQAVALWQSLLESGKRLPAVGGSDYHRDGLFQILGGPCMGVYAMGNTPAEILAAVRAGHNFIRFSPKGPSVQLSSGDNIMGDARIWEKGQSVTIEADGLLTGDVVRVITKQEHKDLFQAPSAGRTTLNVEVDYPGFIRIEIYRTFLPGLPPLPALISNPIYFLDASAI